MTEKDLDIAIEKCESIMEFDTRTMQDRESENGWLFDKVYDLLKFLRQFQFATDTNVGGTSDTISRQTAINAICEDGTRLERHGQYSMTMAERKQRDVDILEALPSAQTDHIGDVTEMVGDAISRQALLDAVESVDWYHQNKNGEMVHGANDNEHQAWYKADDIYKAIESVPTAQLAQDLPKGCTDTISRQAAIETVRKAKDKSEAHRMLMQLPPAQPEIIRCKDCKYNPNPPECGNADCVLFYGMTDQMGFCHHGERRKQE